MSLCAFSLLCACPSTPRGAQTLYRDVVPSYRRHALRAYEIVFHLLCWPVAAVLAGVFALTRGAAARGGDLTDLAAWCMPSPAAESLALGLCLYGPVLLAVGFTLVTYATVQQHSRERRVSRITSYYLLSFAVCWLPSLVCRILAWAHSGSSHGSGSGDGGVAAGSSSGSGGSGGSGGRGAGAGGALAAGGDYFPPFVLLVLEAFCLPLQGALNALVYGWSLPSIRDVYRAMLLGTDGADGIGGGGGDGADRRSGGAAAAPLANGHASYSPPRATVGGRSLDSALAQEVEVAARTVEDLQRRFSRGNPA